MTLVWIVGAFLVFMVLIWSVHRADDYASVRFGYAPFALPNALFMSISNGLLLMAIMDGGAQYQVLAALAAAATLGMFLIVRRRTNGWVALFAASMLLLCAPVLVFSLLFRALAQTGTSDGD